MRIRRVSVFAVVAMLVCGAVVAEEDKPMTNQDVINLVKAKVSESTISMAIRAAKPGFDTSAGAIVKLSSAGVPESVVQAMIASKGVSAAAASSPPVVSSNLFNPEEVVLVNGEEQRPMRYLVAQVRMAARALGMGGMAKYAALRGTQAEFRTKNRQPAFIVAIPTNAQPDSYVTLASFVVRKNGTREVVIGGGYMSYSSGVSKDHVMPVTSEKLPDQARAPKGFILYRVNVTTPLALGEYAFILYSSQVKSVGLFSDAGSDSYFDFGVDG